MICWFDDVLLILIHGFAWFRVDLAFPEVSPFFIHEGFRGGDGGGRLDPLATQQIHGSKPTKHHQNSQNTRKNFGAIFVGIFGLGRKTIKLGQKTQWGGSEIVINVALDTKMM